MTKFSLRAVLLGGFFKNNFFNANFVVRLINYKVEWGEKVVYTFDFDFSAEWTAQKEKKRGFAKKTFQLILQNT